MRRIFFTAFLAAIVVLVVAAAGASAGKQVATVTAFNANSLGDTAGTCTFSTHTEYSRMLSGGQIYVALVRGNTAIEQNNGAMNRGSLATNFGVAVASSDLVAGTYTFEVSVVDRKGNSVSSVVSSPFTIAQDGACPPADFVTPVASYPF